MKTILMTTRTCRNLLLVGVVFTICVAIGQAQTAPPRPITTTEKLLKEMAADYKPFQGKHSFIVTYSGKHKKSIDVIVIDAAEGIAAMADVAAGKEVNFSAQLMRKLLEYNLKADYVKVGISDIGSVRVSSEIQMIAVNSKALERIVDQTAAAADEVAGFIAAAK